MRNRIIQGDCSVILKTLPAASADFVLTDPPYLVRYKDRSGRTVLNDHSPAGRLAAAGFRPSFDEGPDLQVEFAGLPFAIQCKRPLSAAGLEKNIQRLCIYPNSVSVFL